jgi:hypothetical protein
VDIGKRDCKACIMSSDGSIVGETKYNNTLSEAEIFASSMVKKYVAVWLTIENWEWAFTCRPRMVQLPQASVFEQLRRPPSEKSSAHYCIKSWESSNVLLSICLFKLLNDN